MDVCGGKFESTLPQAFWVPGLPQVALLSPSQGTNADSQVGRGLGEELCASKERKRRE